MTAAPLASANTAQVGYVYAIGACRGPVKIGRARDVAKRLVMLQVGHPSPLRIVQSVCVSDAAAVERAVHLRLRAHRVRGEWFETSGEEIASAIDDAIQSLALTILTPTPAARLNKLAQSDNPIARFLAERGVRPRAFAAQLGITDAHMSMVLRGLRGVSFELARAIVAQSEGAISFDDLNGMMGKVVRA